MSSSKLNTPVEIISFLVRKLMEKVISHQFIREYSLLLSFLSKTCGLIINIRNLKPFSKVYVTMPKQFQEWVWSEIGFIYFWVKPEMGLEKSHYFGVN